jgi:hypothetical protein
VAGVVTLGARPFSSFAHLMAVAWRVAESWQAAAAMLLGCVAISIWILWPFWGYIFDGMPALIGGLL